MDSKKRAQNHLSAPISPNYLGFNTSHSESIFDPPPAYQPPLQNNNHQQAYYYPTPAPQTVIVHQKPTRSKDACCWGW